MSDFFSSLIFRSLGASVQVAPRHAARFEAELPKPAEPALTETVDEVETHPRLPGDLGDPPVRRPPAEQGTAESLPAPQGSDPTTPSTEEQQHDGVQPNQPLDEQLPVHLSGLAVPAGPQAEWLTPGSPPDRKTGPASDCGTSVVSSQRPPDEWAGRLPYRSDSGADNGTGAQPTVPLSSTAHEPDATPQMVAARTFPAVLPARTIDGPPNSQRHHAAPTSPRPDPADLAPKETVQSQTPDTSPPHVTPGVMARRAIAIDRIAAGPEPRDHTAIVGAVIRPRPELAVERDSPVVSERPRPDAGPTIEVTIGRVEVRGYANTPTSTRRRPAAQPGVLPLAEYLARRRGDR